MSVSDTHTQSQTQAQTHTLSLPRLRVRLTAVTETETCVTASQKMTVGEWTRITCLVVVVTVMLLCFSDGTPDAYYLPPISHWLFSVSNYSFHAKIYGVPVPNFKPIIFVNIVSNQVDFASNSYFIFAQGSRSCFETAGSLVRAWSTTSRHFRYYSTIR